jgi:hypothetical protein
VERDLGPVSSVCGNSLGGGLAAHVATTRPHLQAVTVNPAPVPTVGIGVGVDTRPGTIRDDVVDVVTGSSDRARPPSRLGSRKIGALAVALALITGGCMPPNHADESRVTDHRPVLISLAEKEALGYDQPEGKRNPELQRLANSNREQIYAIVHPHVERTTGRQVELTGINAYHPTLMVQVTWRTLDEPYVAGAEDVRLRDDGTLPSEAYIGPSLTVINAETVSGIFAMAYRTELDAMREHLLTAHPEFGGGLPRGYRDLSRRADPMFTASPGTLLTPGTLLGGDSEKVGLASDAWDPIYQAYLADPDRSDEQWRKLVDKATANVPLSLSVHLVLADPDLELTEELARRVGDDIRSNPLFGRFDEWTIFTYSNLIGRESEDFHRSFWMTAAKTGEGWWISEWVDGATVHR